MISLFKKQTKSGLVMSITNINIPYTKMVEILGKPHEIEHHEILNYDVKAVWELSFLDINFHIEYNSNEYTTDYMGKHKIGHHKLFSLEEIPFGKIRGLRELSILFIYPVLQIEAGMTDVAYHYPIKYLFEEL